MRNSFLVFLVFSQYNSRIGDGTIYESSYIVFYINDINVLEIPRKILYNNCIWNSWSPFLGRVSNRDFRTWTTMWGYAPRYRPITAQSFEGTPGLGSGILPRNILYNCCMRNSFLVFLVFS
jgi:hypothetical protein